MPDSHAVEFSIAVEGSLDEIVLRRLVEQVGATLKAVYGKSGKKYLRQRLRGYNQAAQFRPWVVLVDLNLEYDCAPLLRAEWLPTVAARMCFRIAVREIEAWLLADRERVASFLRVGLSHIPLDPEALNDPKQTVINLARRSRQSAIREDMVPRPGSGRLVGPAYNSRLIEFAESQWRPIVAERNSDSLRRCHARLRELAEGGPALLSEWEVRP